MSGTDIFLSYSREDRVAARHFAESLTEEGFSVWWDNVLHSGDTFDEVIEKQLKAAKAVVVLWSPRSVASRWVRAEATIADRRNKLAPVIIETCDRPIIFELTHTADLADWTGDTSDPRWRNYVQDLHRLVQRGRDAEAAADGDGPRPVAKPQSYSPPRERQPAAKLDLVGGTASRHHRRDEPVHAAPAHEDARPAPVHAEEHAGSSARPESTGPQDHRDEFHCLEMTDGEGPPTRFVVGPMGLRIGRTAPADIIIANSSVSREHCIIGLANDELLVSDLNSTNGTFIDDERIGRAAILPVGSVLRVGTLSLKHEIRSHAELGPGHDPVGRNRKPSVARVAIS